MSTDEKKNNRLVTLILTDGEIQTLDRIQLKRLNALTPEELELVESGQANCIVEAIGMASLKCHFKDMFTVPLYRVTMKTATRFDTRGERVFARLFFDLDRLYSQVIQTEKEFAASKKKSK